MSRLLDEIEKLEQRSNELKVNAKELSDISATYAKRNTVDSLLDAQISLDHAKYLIAKAEGIDYATKQIRSMLFCELSKKEMK